MSFDYAIGPISPRGCDESSVVGVGLLVSAVALSARLGRPVSAEHRARLSAVDWAGLPDASDLQAAVADFLAQWRADPEQAGAALFEAVLGWRRGAAMARRRAQPFDWELRRDCGHG